ncbi:GNAT family N-acetyltransferase [Rubellimicrobium roseum]|uniref:GNAT family N-acetyltransferase n=1 Tax=Rubellimicrobium roseum TaxID=687525 RepID=A0A5C4NF95_9RHOB|nr:GNAT family N-acetyltransferase [Rubellimicrobium roseum]TNC71766.1 GNAT family N-acetyltransferase [Rubellimicrobium roseum]
MTMPAIRRMTAADLDHVLDWAAVEGWNPGLGDAAAFHAADPEGFLLAEVAGDPVGAISVVNHSDVFAFLGLYLCRPEWRGQGIGMALWREGLTHAGGRTIGLDGVAAQEANYARSGFVRTGATIRFEGPRVTGDSPTLRPMRPEDLPALLALDRRATGVERARFLSAWTRTTSDRRTIVLEEGGAIQGFATARLCRLGCKIGPIIAPDAECGLALTASEAEIGTRVIDVPEANHEFISALVARGYRETFRTARMYRGPAPQGDGREQAIATMELG